MTVLTPEYFAARWSYHMSPRLIKDHLIDRTGRCCAQGDVLRCAGYSDQQLRDITQEAADREVARLLGISLAESMLIRIVNDSTGRPQDVFQAPEKVLGPHYRLWRAFARHIDRMSYQDWERIAAEWTAAQEATRGSEWEEEGYLEGIAARKATWAAGAAAVREAVWDATGGASADAVEVTAIIAAPSAASQASDEIIGWSILKEPFFLKMFFDDPREWVRSIEEADD